MSEVGERLRAHIRTRGAIPFSEFMEEALYGEAGYYRRADWPVGGTGDFVTAPSLSPLFAASTARLLHRLGEELGGPAELLEVGYGDGTHLRGVAARAPGLRLRGVDRNARTVPPGVGLVTDLAAIEPGEIVGLVFSFELFDALPVRRLVGAATGELGEPGEISELRVGLDARGELEWQVAPADLEALPGLLSPLRSRLEPGQVADVSPFWEPMYRQLATRIGRGLVVTCDYGFDGGRLYDSRVRPHGTLAAYRRHRVHRDALRDPGEQDLTAHVDFDVLRRAGEEEGLTTHALARLANWLVACGLFGDLEGADERARIEAMAVLDLEGTGSETRVLVQSRGLAPEAVARLFDAPLISSR